MPYDSDCEFDDDDYYVKPDDRKPEHSGAMDSVSPRWMNTYTKPTLTPLFGDSHKYESTDTVVETYHDSYSIRRTTFPLMPDAAGQPIQDPHTMTMSAKDNTAVSPIRLTFEMVSQVKAGPHIVNVDQIRADIQQDKVDVLLQLFHDRDTLEIMHSHLVALGLTQFAKQHQAQQVLQVCEQQYGDMALFATRMHQETDSDTPLHEPVEGKIDEDTAASPYQACVTAKMGFQAEHSPVTKDSAIEVIANDVLLRYYQQGRLKEEHGALHVSRVASYIPDLVALYQQAGDEAACRMSAEDIKLVQVAALFHDLGRFIGQHRDHGDDKPEWERESAKRCYEYLIKLGVDKVKAERIADAIANKDSDITKPKSIYRRLLQNADSLDVYRASDWHFDYRYMNFYLEHRQKIETIPECQQRFYSLLIMGLSLVRETGDLKKKHIIPGSTQYQPPVHDKHKKQRIECSPNCFARVAGKLAQIRMASPTLPTAQHPKQIGSKRCLSPSPLFWQGAFKQHPTTLPEVKKSRQPHLRLLIHAKTEA